MQMDVIRVREVKRKQERSKERKEKGSHRTMFRKFTSFPALQSPPERHHVQHPAFDWNDVEGERNLSRYASSLVPLHRVAKIGAQLGHSSCKPLEVPGKVLNTRSTDLQE